MFNSVFMCYVNLHHVEIHEILLTHAHTVCTRPFFFLTRVKRAARLPTRLVVTLPCISNIAAGDDTISEVLNTAIHWILVALKFMDIIILKSYRFCIGILTEIGNNY